MIPPHVYIAATGMVTPVGLNTIATRAAISAGVSAYADSVCQNRKFESMRMALIPDEALPALNADLLQLNLNCRQQRLLRIATPALRQVVDQVPLKTPPPLFLALPESIPGCKFAPHPGFLNALEIQTGIKFNCAESRIFNSGRAGGIEAIQAAFNYFSISGNSIALVGGLDTYLDLLLLAVLDKDERVLANEASNAFAPGEAGGFLLLTVENVVQYLPNPPRAILYPPGLATEPGHRYSDQPCLGDGLANAFGISIKNASGPSINTIYTTLNGEHFGSKELGVAYTRNQRNFDKQIKIEHPADCIGDIGAAFGPISIGLATVNNTGNVALHACSSEKEKRAAVITRII
ncbi:MAG TPA: hypothetical protein VIZ65_13225 [Cellvibrionaceae bacterium]